MAIAATTTWVIRDSSLGLPAINVTSTTQGPVLGTTCRAVDQSGTYGEGEFIYLLGVASTVVGSLVSYNATTFQTALVPSTANLNTPVAVAMSANVASQYGWYQIGGYGVVAKIVTVNATPQPKIYISGTAGLATTVSASGKEVLGMKGANLATVASATTALAVIMDRPFMQGQIT